MFGILARRHMSSDAPLRGRTFLVCCSRYESRCARFPLAFQRHDVDPSQASAVRAHERGGDSIHIPALASVTTTDQTCMHI